GTLLVNGSLNKPVVFTSSSNIPQAGDWGGIDLRSTSINTVIRHATIEYAEEGVSVEAGVINYLIDNSTIRSNSLRGLYLNATDGIVSNSSVYDHYGPPNTPHSGIYVYDASPTIKQCIIYNNDYGIRVASVVLGAARPLIQGNYIADNNSSQALSAGIYIAGSNPIVSSNIISSNKTGIYSTAGSPTINLNNVITRNGVGITIRNSGSPIIDGNSIIDNAIGINVYRDSFSYSHPYLTISNNDIYGNTSLDLRAFVKVDPLQFKEVVNNWWGTPVISEIRASSLEVFDVIALQRNHGLITNNFSVTNKYISPLSSPNTQDSTFLSANITEPSTWVVDILNSNQTSVKSYSGNSAIINAPWDGTNTAGNPVADGNYLFLVKIANQPVGFERVIVDNIAPTSILDATLNGGSFNTSPMPLIGSSADNNLKNYSLSIADGISPTAGDYTNIEAPIQKIVVNGTLLNWDFADLDGLHFETSGQKTLKLTTVDYAGNSSTSIVEFTLTHASIKNVIHDTYSIKPSQGETVSVNFDLGLPALQTAIVYWRFYPEDDNTTNNLKAEVSATFTSEGPKTMTWNGMGLSGEYLSDDVYRFELVTDINGVESTYSNLFKMPTNSQCSPITAADIQPEKNHYLTVECVVTLPVRYYALSGSVIFNDAYPAGTYTLMWDMRDPDNKLIDGFSATTGIYHREIKQDSVIIQGNEPKVTGTGIAPNIEVIATPHTVFHSFDQVSEIVYRISLDSHVSVKLLAPCFSSNAECEINHDNGILLFEGDLAANDGAGDPINHTFEWRGYDYQATTVDTNNIMVNENGYYTFSIKAISIQTGLETIYRGILNLYY
ncbi:MAG: right-handed parallel beta-helix repeat-containing protein, partial [Methylococcales bacterium]